jgi:hypothetical protein
LELVISEEGGLPLTDCDMTGTCLWSINLSVVCSYIHIYDNSSLGFMLSWGFTLSSLNAMTSMLGVNR